MSLDAILWARGQKVGRGPAKSVLIALADYASENFRAFPSLDALIEWTEQNRKTVIANMKFLQEKGWITDTGERVGRTGQIPVYQINQANGVEVKVGSRFSRRDKSKSTENGTVPNMDDNSTVSGSKESQKRTQTVPETEPVTVINTIEQSGNSSARGTRLPDDWKLTRAMGEWALAEQPTWNAEHVRKIADKFRDYWKGVPGQRGRKTDWPATWRNWVRDEKPLNGTAAQGGMNKQEQLEARNRDVAARLSAEFQAKQAGAQQ